MCARITHHCTRIITCTYHHVYMHALHSTGGLHLAAGSYSTVTNCALRGNAAAASGGAVTLSVNATLDVSSTGFELNTAASGAAVHTSAALLTLDGATFDGTFLQQELTFACMQCVTHHDASVVLLCIQVLPFWR